MLLLPEQLEVLEQLAGIGYTPQECAQYFGIHGHTWSTAFEAHDSELKYHYDRGCLIAKADVDMKLLENAKSGNFTAIMLLQRSQKERVFEANRERMLNGNL